MFAGHTGCTEKNETKLVLLPLTEKKNWMFWNRNQKIIPSQTYDLKKHIYKKIYINTSLPLSNINAIELQQWHTPQTPAKASHYIFKFYCLRKDNNKTAYVTTTSTNSLTFQLDIWVTAWSYLSWIVTTWNMCADLWYLYRKL